MKRFVPYRVCGKMACLFVAFFCACLLVQACSHEEDGAEVGLKRSVSAETVVVQEHEIPELRFFPGTVKSKVSIMLAAKMPGYVKTLPHDIGDFVKKGELLVRLDDAEVRARIGALKQASAALSKERAGVQARFEYVKATYNRIKNLHSQGSATQDELDRITSQKDAVTSQMAAINARIRQIGSELKAAENQLDYVVIEAPSDGWITKRMVDKGAFVMPGVPLIQFESSGDGLWFAADVDESLASALNPANKVTILVPAAGRTITAQITRVSRAANPRSHTFSILCDISSSGLNAGLYGRIFIPIGKKKAVLVPCSAILDRGGIEGVFVVDDENRLHWRVIKTGMKWQKSGDGLGLCPPDSVSSPSSSHDERCMQEVFTGIEAGERVVSSNLSQVKQGSYVE